MNNIFDSESDSNYRGFVYRTLDGEEAYLYGKQE